MHIFSNCFCLFIGLYVPVGHKLLQGKTVSSSLTYFLLYDTHQINAERVKESQLSLGRWSLRWSHLSVKFPLSLSLSPCFFNVDPSSQLLNMFTLTPPQRNPPLISYLTQTLPYFSSYLYSPASWKKHFLLLSLLSCVHWVLCPSFHHTLQLISDNDLLSNWLLCSILQHGHPLLPFLLLHLDLHGGLLFLCPLLLKGWFSQYFQSWLSSILSAHNLSKGYYPFQWFKQPGISCWSSPDVSPELTSLFALDWIYTHGCSPIP